MAEIPKYTPPTKHSRAFDTFAHNMSENGNDVYASWKALTNEQMIEMWREYPNVARAVQDVIYSEACLVALMVVEMDSIGK